MENSSLDMVLCKRRNLLENLRRQEKALRQEEALRQEMEALGQVVQNWLQRVDEDLRQAKEALGQVVRNWLQRVDKEAARQTVLTIVLPGSQNTKVHRRGYCRRWSGVIDPDCNPFFRQKKTHKGAKGGRGRERSIIERMRDLRDLDPTPHIQKTGRPQVGFPFSQANCGVEGRDESRYGLEGSGWRDGGGEGSGPVESECRDAEGGEGSRSGANQDRDGKGEGSSSGEGQGQDRGEGSASGENQGGDRNAEGSGSNDDEDERERQPRVSGDIEQGIQENNLEEIDFSGIAEAFLAITGATSIAAVEFHNRGAISSTTLGRLIAIGVVGFLCCMASMLKRSRRPKVARILGTIGAGGGGLEFLMLVSENFSSYYGWMILGLGSLAILLICVWAFRR